MPRPNKYTSATVVIRVPVEALAEIRRIIAGHEKK